MEGKQSLTQRDHEIVAIALTCLENTAIDFKMLAEKGGYKNANSAREGYRVVKKKLLAATGVDAGTGRLLASKESHSTAASSSTMGTPARTQPARIQPTRAAAARTPSAGAALTRATSARTVSTKAASAKTPAVRAEATRTSSTRTVPAKRGRRGAAASPSTSEEGDYTSNDTEDSDDEMEGGDEEDYKPRNTRRPLTKKAKASTETKVSNNDSLETAGPEKLDEHGYQGDDEATVQDKETEELGEHAYHGDDEKPKKEFHVVVPVFNTETEENNIMDDNNAGGDAQAANSKPEDADDVAMSVATKPTAKTTQNQGVGHQTKGIHQEMDIVMGETQEDATVGADQGVDNKGAGAVLTDDDSEMHGAPVESESGKAADPEVLDDMAGILMQAAALEAQMKKNEESSSKESKA